jgi:hypothetical protein
MQILKTGEGISLDSGIYHKNAPPRTRGGILIDRLIKLRLTSILYKVDVISGLLYAVLYFIYFQDVQSFR